MLKQKWHEPVRLESIVFFKKPKKKTIALDKIHLIVDIQNKYLRYDKIKLLIFRAFIAESVLT